MIRYAYVLICVPALVQRIYGWRLESVCRFNGLFDAGFQQRKVSDVRELFG